VSQTDTHPAVTPISDWTLERIALGELVGDEMVRAHQRLAAETGGLQRLRDLEASTAAILAEHPPEIVVPQILARIARHEAPGTESFSRGWWSGLGVGLAAAVAALAFVLVSPSTQTGPEPAPDTTRLKGLSPHLVVHRASASGPQRVREGESVSAGDVLQLGYVAGGERYGAILSIDGAGQVTLHHPEFATLLPVLTPDGRVDLPFAYELDAAPAFERFVFVTSDEPIDVDAVLGAARTVAGTDNAAGAPLPLPAQMHQESLLLSKGDRP